MRLSVLGTAACLLATPATAVISRSPCLLKKDAGYYFACDVYRGEDATPVFVATFKRPFEIGASPLRLQDKKALGETGSGYTHFHYYVSVLGNVSPTDSTITDAGKDDTHSWPADPKRCTGAVCDPKDKGCTDPKTATAGAFQWDDRTINNNTAGACVRLTGTATAGADLTTNTYYGYSAYLIDEQDAAKGIVLKRGGGSPCGSKGNRKLQVTLECGTEPEEQANEPDDEEYVFEDSTCTYEISMKTSYGCPDQCKSPADVLGPEEAGMPTPQEVCNHQAAGGAHGTCRTLISGAPECACAEAEGATDSTFVGPGCTFACPGENSKLGLCSARGHCSFNAGASSTGKAACFCNSGFMGETCERDDPHAGKGTTEQVIAPVSPVPWIFNIIFAALLLAFWKYHRDEMGEPFCCCSRGGGNSMAGFEDV